MKKKELVKKIEEFEKKVEEFEKKINTHEIIVKGMLDNIQTILANQIQKDIDHFLFDLSQALKKSDSNQGQQQKRGRGRPRKIKE